MASNGDDAAFAEVSNGDLNRIIDSACDYIHGGSEHTQEKYTVWRETYKDVFGVYPSWRHIPHNGRRAERVATRSNAT